jgi:hypothetical protein
MREFVERCPKLVHILICTALKEFLTSLDFLLLESFIHAIFSLLTSSLMLVMYSNFGGARTTKCSTPAKEISKALLKVIIVAMHDAIYASRPRTQVR